jgi:hypothetical protein
MMIPPERIDETDNDCCWSFSIQRADGRYKWNESIHAAFAKRREKPDFSRPLDKHSDSLGFNEEPSANAESRIPTNLEPDSRAGSESQEQSRKQDSARTVRLAGMKSCMNEYRRNVEALIRSTNK